MSSNAPDDWVEDAEINMVGFRHAQVPEDIIFDPDVKDKAVRVFAAILRYGATSGRRFPRYKTLAGKLGCHEDTVGRAIGNLQEAGWLTVHGRAGRSSMLVPHAVKGVNPSRTPRDSAGTTPREIAVPPPAELRGHIPRVLTESPPTPRSTDRGGPDRGAGNGRRSRDGSEQRRPPADATSPPVGRVLGPDDGWDTPDVTAAGLAAARKTLQRPVKNHLSNGG